jgi:hypothetical protein
LRSIVSRYHGEGVLDRSASRLMLFREDPTMASDTKTPVHFASLTDVARRLERKELSPVDLTRTMLERIETVDARLKSYATVSGPEGLTQDA